MKVGKPYESMEALWKYGSLMKVGKPYESMEALWK